MHFKHMFFFNLFWIFFCWKFFTHSAMGGGGADPSGEFSPFLRGSLSAFLYFLSRKIYLMHPFRTTVLVRYWNCSVRIFKLVWLSKIRICLFLSVDTVLWNWGHSWLGSIGCRKNGIIYYNNINNKFKYNSMVNNITNSSTVLYSYEDI